MFWNTNWMEILRKLNGGRYDCSLRIRIIWYRIKSCSRKRWSLDSFGMASSFGWTQRNILKIDRSLRCLKTILGQVWKKLLQKIWLWKHSWWNWKQSLGQNLRWNSAQFSKIRTFLFKLDWSRYNSSSIWLHWSSWRIIVKGPRIDV